MKSEKIILTVTNRYLSVALVILISCGFSWGQTIDSIIVVGNKKTKERIVLNELFFKEGDMIDGEFTNKIEHSKAALMRLKIFTDVDISMTHLKESTEENILVTVTVKELWPLYPIPKFDIIDRSYTVWIKEHGASIDRVLYGLNLTHINTTGRADQLNLDWQMGFKRQFKLDYHSPPLTQDQKLRMSTRFEYSSSRDADIGITDDNELIRLRDESQSLLNEWSYGTKLIYRHTREFSIETDINFVHLDYLDTINVVNPMFYNSSINWHDNWHIKLVYDSRSNVLFATRGNRIELEYSRSGLFQKGLRSQGFKSNWIQTYTLPYRTSGIINDFRLGLRDWGEENYYYFQKSISRELSDLRAYETSFIPGEGYVMNRFKVYHMLLDKKFNCFPAIVRKHIPFVPYQLYFSLNFDMAYIKNSDENITNLNNTWLYSWGPSLEFVFFNNFKFAVDYSLDREGQSVFNLNFDTSF